MTGRKRDPLIDDLDDLDGGDLEPKEWSQRASSTEGLGPIGSGKPEPLEVSATAEPVVPRNAAPGSGYACQCVPSRCTCSAAVAELGDACGRCRRGKHNMTPFFTDGAEMTDWARNSPTSPFRGMNMQFVRVEATPVPRSRAPKG